MTEAEAKYEAEEAADKLTGSLEKLQSLVERTDDVPFGEMSKHYDKIAGEVYSSLLAMADVRIALSKIKVRESA